ncbi:MAG: ferrous iron transport protein A [Candidatus Paracaedibacteraceae bacterium]|nr:ferrous iron transport protein A [Candidatus Paracaedibacteraceae bacterium]
MLLLINHIYCIIDICAENIDRFHNLGLHANTLVKIKHIQGLKGPIVIETGGRLIALRKREFECLTLQ